MPPRLSALAAVLALLLLPQSALACACGCSVFSVGAGSILPTASGGTAWLEYDFMDQAKNWSGTKAAPAADNSDKEIRTQFFNMGAQYMFSCGWGVMVEVPVWSRTFRTDVGGGTIDRLGDTALGDIRLSAVYSGFSKAMTTGVTFGLKLPTGDDRAPGFDRDTQIGSGSTDLLLGAYHVGTLTRDERLSYFVNGQLEAPFASVGGYRPGATVDGAVGVIYRPPGYDDAKVRLAPVLQLIASARAGDAGPAANPANSGYQRLMISPGLEAQVGRWRLYGDVEFPVYQHVRGDQLTAPDLVKVVVSRTF